MSAIKDIRTVIARPINEVFAHIIDLQNYSRWLGGSSLYAATIELSESPAKLGTHYTDRGKITVMRGSVTAFDPPRGITFTQTSKYIVGTLKVTIHYQLESPQNGASSTTMVNRSVDIRGTGLVWLIEPLLPALLRPEEVRIVQGMKTYLERS